MATTASPRYPARRADFRLAHPRLGRVSLAGRLHDVGTQARDREDFVVHGALPPAGVGGSPPFTLEEEPRGCQ